MSNITVKKYLIYINDKDGNFLLSIDEHGVVEAASIEAASKAGKSFTDAIRSNFYKPPASPGREGM